MGGAAANGAGGRGKTAGRDTSRQLCQIPTEDEQRNVHGWQMRRIPRSIGSVLKAENVGGGWSGSPQNHRKQVYKSGAPRRAKG